MNTSWLANQHVSIAPVFKPGRRTEDRLPMPGANLKTRFVAKTNRISGKSRHFDKMSGLKRTKPIASHKTSMYEYKMSIALPTMGIALPTMAMLSYKMWMSRDRTRPCVLTMDIADRTKWIACVTKWKVSYTMRINACTM